MRDPKVFFADMPDITDPIGNVFGHQPFIVKKGIEALQEYIQQPTSNWWAFLYPVVLN